MTFGTHCLKSLLKRIVYCLQTTGRHCWFCCILRISLNDLPLPLLVFSYAKCTNKWVWALPDLWTCYTSCSFQSLPFRSDLTLTKFTTVLLSNYSWGFLGWLEFAGMENDGPSQNGGGWNLQEWKMTDEIVGVEFAGLENDGRSRRGGICRTGKWRTKSQGWNLQDWKMTDEIAVASFSSPANSTPATSSVIFQSCKFQSCKFSYPDFYVYCREIRHAGKL